MKNLPGLEENQTAYKFNEHALMLQNVTKCYKMLQNVTKCYKMLQNVTKCYKML